MTIGIAAFGPNAGRAVFEALRNAERVAWGSIHGFAAFAVITADKSVLRFQTHRGGTRTLFLDGEETGVWPPHEVATAEIAAVMSSGPDRPEPLSQFVAAAADAGIVTGHRLPNMPGIDGIAINEETLALMRAGYSPRDAVNAILDRNPEADAGLIAVNPTGQMYARNSERVQRRPDLGQARREDVTNGVAVEVLHNAIFPSSVIAALCAEIALGVMVPASPPEGWVTVEAGTVIELGAENAIVVGDGLLVKKVVTTDARVLSGRRNCAAIYLGSLVQHGDSILGETMFEPNVIVEDGRILSMSGQSTLRLGFRRRAASARSL